MDRTGSLEKTLLLIKPDGVERNHIEDILSFIRNKTGLRLIFVKSILSPTPRQIAIHYSVHKKKPFYPWLRKQFLGHGIVAVIYEGPNAVQSLRDAIGTTDPAKCDPETTVRGLYRCDTMLLSQQEGRATKNTVHASETIEDFLREIEAWFTKTELHNLGLW